MMDLMLVFPDPLLPINKTCRTHHYSNIYTKYSLSSSFWVNDETNAEAKSEGVKNVQSRDQWAWFEHSLLTDTPTFFAHAQ